MSYWPEVETAIGVKLTVSGEGSSYSRKHKIDSCNNFRTIYGQIIRFATQLAAINSSNILGYTNKRLTIDCERWVEPCEAHCCEDFGGGEWYDQCGS